MDGMSILIAQGKLTPALYKIYWDGIVHSGLIGALIVAIVGVATILVIKSMK